MKQKVYGLSPRSSRTSDNKFIKRACGIRNNTPRIKLNVCVKPNVARELVTVYAYHRLLRKTLCNALRNNDWHASQTLIYDTSRMCLYVIMMTKTTIKKAQYIFLC